MENEKKGFFKKIIGGLTKTRETIAQSVENVFKAFAKVDEELFEQLEEALILADCGANPSLEIVERLRQKVKKEKLQDAEDVKQALTEIIANTMIEAAPPAEEMPTPAVILVIGVNGVGKTTSIGKLATNFVRDGKQVVLAAADTFRAAAIDQLEIWASRANCTIIKHQENSDPAAVVFDACAAAKARKADVLLVDTAGRLHNKKNLMEELRKISRVVDREFPDVHRETFLVLDATTGQNALSQAKTFMGIADITGIVLTKLDGTAKGGIVLSIATELKIPVRYIGIGEQADDLQVFDAAAFARGMFFDEIAQTPCSQEQSVV
ncbi:MAG: signal recognition particle-docking protein FtsY [Defluviitaleaceae bacterium]|nr:signal recognition particle-docking protein FtsY [Defluviitaleaceae bacterium]